MRVSVAVLVECEFPQEFVILFRLLWNALAQYAVLASELLLGDA
jgi:hypothetical protein